MRVVSSPELALIQGQRFKIDTVVEIENDVEWVDVSGRFVSADVTFDIDQHAASVVMTFARDDAANTASLSPLRGDSTANADGPLMTAGRRFRISVACVAIGATFSGATYHELITGRIDKPDFSQTPMSVEARDLGGLLIDTIAIADVTYGEEDDPVPAPDAGQQYLDDNIGTDAPTLVDLSGTDYTVTKFRQVNVPVMEGINALATQAGGLVARYKYDAAGVAQLTLYDPLRANTTADVTLTPARYIEVPLAAIDQTNIRNIIRGEFLDPVTGEVLRLEVTDTDSIAAFGPRFMQLSADVFDGMDGNKVLDVLNAALTDLRYPKFDHHVTRLLFWPAEVGDIIEWAPNDVHYDEAQTLAVVGVTHHLERGHGTTTFLCRGTPAGAYLEWIRRQGTGPTGPQIPPSPEFSEPLGESLMFGSALNDGSNILAYGFRDGVDTIRLFSEIGDGTNLPPPDASDTTGFVEISRPEGDIGDNPNYASVLVITARTGFYKRYRGRGVRGGLSSPDWISGVVQAVDPVPAITRGQLNSLTVVQTGDTTNTVTVTPASVDTSADNFMVIMRNEHELPPIAMGVSLAPVVFVDSGLDLSNPQKSYTYDAFILSKTSAGAVTGQRFRYVFGNPPSATIPVWALGTPSPAIVSNTAQVQLSWTATTPGAGAVRVEASLDRVTKRTVGQGALASGTVYDTNPTNKLYRLVAIDLVTGREVAASEWVWYTGGVPPLSNPGALPEFLNGTPKRIFATTFPTPTIRLSVQFSAATPGTFQVWIYRSTTSGVAGFSVVPNGQMKTTQGEWRSPTAAGWTDTESWWKLEARDILGIGVKGTSAVVHYVP